LAYRRRQMMAVRKATRSNSAAQLQPKKPKHRTHPHHLETELFETLHQFNKAFGTALCALERIDIRFAPRLRGKNRAGLRALGGAIGDDGSRIGALRAEANRDLLRLLSDVA